MLTSLLVSPHSKNRTNMKSSLFLELLEGERGTEKTEMKRRGEEGGTEMRTVPAPQPLLQALCSATLQDKRAPHAPAHPGLQN